MTFSLVVEEYRRAININGIEQKTYYPSMEIEIPDLKMQDVGGADLPYLHYDGDASPIIFVHATGFMPWLWHPIIKEFIPQNSVWYRLSVIIANVTLRPAA